MFIFFFKLSPEERGGKRRRKAYQRKMLKMPPDNDSEVVCQIQKLMQTADPGEIFNLHLSVSHSVRIRCIRHRSGYVCFTSIYQPVYPSYVRWWVDLPNLKRIYNIQVMNTKRKRDEYRKNPEFSVDTSSFARKLNIHQIFHRTERRLTNKTDDERIRNTYWRVFDG